MTRRQIIELLIDCTMVAIIGGAAFAWLWWQAAEVERAVKQRTQQRERVEP
jgi:type II secretory pathway component PulJ